MSIRWSLVLQCSLPRVDCFVWLLAFGRGLGGLGMPGMLGGLLAKALTSMDGVNVAWTMSDKP